MLNKFSYEYLFSYSCNIGDMYRMVKSPMGLRNIGYITDGEVWGDKIRGKILPGGGDWCVIRKDGVSCCPGYDRNGKRRENLHAVHRPDGYRRERIRGLL